MLLSPSDLDELRAYQPELRPQNALMSAAVAIVIRDGTDGTEILLMQRCL